ncbi:MAG: RpiB/LacA/LacB family sugar-phosphate isomerase [bacterium]|nr:RpiB/LacA/LacB family sugar-phosphate isomerase [bacterium]
MLKIYFAGDHAGFDLKNALIESVREAGHEAFDFGPHTLDPADDYPDYVGPCAERVAGEPGSFGIIIGASGEGEAMAANRVKGARAAVFYGPPSHSQTDAGGAVLTLIESARAHNDANILSLGARFVSAEEAEKAVRIFLTTPFSGDERHKRRLAKF